MTDNEMFNETIETLRLISEKAKEQEDLQLRNAATLHLRMVNSYTKAGFTRKEAIMVTTEIIKGIMGIKK